MVASEARIKANQRNARLSTGPKTVEGKAASRLNAIRHGLAGSGDLLGPGEDAEVVASRTKAFLLDFGVAGEVGQLLAHRAAVLSIRMNQNFDRQINLRAADKEAARVAFDQDLVDDYQNALGALDTGGFAEALEILEAFPDGVVHLKTTWLGLRASISNRSEDFQSAILAVNKAALWLGLTDAEADAIERGHFEPIDAELARLEEMSKSMVRYDSVIDQLRQKAVEDADLDASPEAKLAYRYETAAERGMYRAMKEMRQLREAHEDRIKRIIAPEPARSQPVPPPLPAPSAPPRTEPLGSFRAEVISPQMIDPQPVPAPTRPAMTPAEHRKNRPDLRKLARSCR